MMSDEPTIALPTARLIAVTLACCAVAAAAWIMIGLMLGAGRETLTSGVTAAVFTALCAILALLITMPWKPKPASTAMAVWLAGDMLGAALSLGGAYLLYSATLRVGGPLSLGLQPLFLGVAAAFFLVLLGKAICVAQHVKSRFP